MEFEVKGLDKIDFETLLKLLDNMCELLQEGVTALESIAHNIKDKQL